MQVVSELTQLDTAPSTPATTPERESPPLAGTSRRQHRGRRNSNLPSLGSSSRCCCSNHDDTDKDHDNDFDNDTDEDQTIMVTLIRTMIMMMKLIRKMTMINDDGTALGYWVTPIPIMTLTTVTMIVVIMIT